MKRLLLLTLVVCLSSACLSSVHIAKAEELLPADRPIAEVIDHYVDKRIAALKTTSAPIANDHVILRRTMLDLVGRPPSLVEAQAYYADTNPQKRDELISQLIHSDGYVRHQADEFDQLLMQDANGSVRAYLTEAFQDNRGWDVMFREMMLGEEDDPEQKGAIEFVKRRVSDIDKLTTEASSIFLGVNVSCAQCHNHPFVEDWTQDLFYGMKSFFDRTFDNGGLIGERDYGLVSYKTTEGESRDAKLVFISGLELPEPESPELTDEEKKAEKKLLDELKKKKEAPPAPKVSLRAQLVDVALQEGQNELLAKAIVNHLWARFYGRGLVDPVDQMHAENPPSHPELLDWLARDFISHGYDLRRLIDGMVRSQTYARSSRFAEQSPPASAFAVATVRPLRPHAYAAVLKLGATNPDQFPADMKPEDCAKRLEGAANSARSLASLFEQPGPSFQVSVDEALLMSNGDRVRRDLLREGADTLLGKVQAVEDRGEAIDLLFWNIFSRPPEATEAAALETFLDARTDRLPQAYEQVIWALLTSSECRFNY